MNSDEKCSLCGVPIYDVSVFHDNTLCSECRFRHAEEDSVPLQMPAAVPGTWYEQLPCLGLDRNAVAMLHGIVRDGSDQP